MSAGIGEVLVGPILYLQEQRGPCKPTNTWKSTVTSRVIWRPLIHGQSTVTSRVTWLQDKTQTTWGCQNITINTESWVGGHHHIKGDFGYIKTLKCGKTVITSKARRLLEKTERPTSLRGRRAEGRRGTCSLDAQ